MKLQSLNCPNCGSPLKTEGNMQVCESCGSSFKIDYDDSDVAYERLSKALIVYILFFGFWIGIGFVVYKAIKGESVLNLDKLAESMTTTTETTVSPYLLVTPEDILADTEFLENAKASVLSEVHRGRDGESVTEYDIPVTEYNFTGDIEIYDCYLLTSEKENRLVFMVKFTYQSERDEDDVQVVYDSLYLKNITFGNTLATGVCQS